MLRTGVVKKGTWLAAILGVLIWSAAADAQTAIPVSPSSPSFGGGFSGFSGFGNTGGFTGSSFSGTSFTGTSFSGGFSTSGGTSSGATFTGSGMNNVNRGGFSGNWAGNFSGGTSGGTASTTLYGATGASGATGGAASAFSLYYFNPLAAGAPNAPRPTWGSPIYGGNATGGALGSYVGGGFGGNTPQANLNSASTNPATALRRASYTASPGFNYRPAGASQVQTEVEQVLARSRSLSPKRNIRVSVEGPAVVLRGTVASDQDRRLAEALVRLTPGVLEVRNELQVP